VEEKLTYVVTGASRGLGREFAHQLLARGDTVIGTARRPEAAWGLRDLGAEVEELDVADDGSVAAFAQRLAGRPVDVLINNAGAQNRLGALESLDFSSLAETFQVNALGPVRVTRALLENLRAGRRRHIAHITSRMGSFGEFDVGNMYGYRASKAALNMFHRCIAEELGPQGFVCVLLHPGWVRTDMGGHEATLSPAESVTGMLRVIDGLSRRDNGAFVDHTGAELPW
jgi:NAD(P)-dependent dehydrogenase (short-subunit alcohol dehydrogenase family)